MWHDDVMNMIEKDHDEAYEFAKEDCLPEDEESFEAIYKNELRKTLLKVREILLEDALRKFRKQR